MTEHTRPVSQPHPAVATSLLEWRQKAEVFGAFAAGLGALAGAFAEYVDASGQKGQ